uniref:Thioesterase domain-containing protein n=1 Tax=Bosea sp. NBC_00436 TaxID=2969620 RepID=A0A9E8CPG9_9HYPH
MNAAQLPLVVLPGARGHAPDCTPFCAAPSDLDRVVILHYPAWRAQLEGEFTAEALAEALVAEILGRVPPEPVVLLGVSIGGHFAYAAALRLEGLGRPVAGLCLIDSGAITAARSAGWKARLAAHAADLLRRGRPGALALHARRLAWRGLFRLAGDDLPGFARRHITALERLSRIDPAFAEEMGMRLLIRITAAWMPSLDSHTPRLNAPAALLRTESSAANDDLWRKRCPELRVIDLPGNHETLFEAENAPALHAAFLAATAVWSRPDPWPAARRAQGG